MRTTTHFAARLTCANAMRGYAAQSQETLRQGGRSRQTTLLVDLDGTLVDSADQHVLAWRSALEAAGIDLLVWGIHRRSGMSGGLFINALLRESEGSITREQIDRDCFAHATACNDLAGEVRPLPGAKALLATLTDTGVPWAIATIGPWKTAGHVIASLEIPDGVPVITRDQVAHA